MLRTPVLGCGAAQMAFAKASFSIRRPINAEALSETAYRDLEQGYRCSEQYAAMQRRYPQLRFWIARCHPSDLVGDPPPQARPPQGSTALNWERSHGER